MITADTITDEQIRELRMSLAREIDAFSPGSCMRLAVWTDFDATTRALGRDLRRKGSGAKREARARCAEILNARAAKEQP